MTKLNSNYQKIPPGYFSSQIDERVKKYRVSNPDVEPMKLGIGNTTEPLVDAVIEGLRKGVEKLSKLETYTGYGDEQGDIRLRQAVCGWYQKRGIEFTPDEIFISDGAKTDSANIGSIFDPDSTVAVTDPVYPVYSDSNIISGKKVVYLEALEENGFIPALPKGQVDLIFICSPNNPTGAVFNKDQLAEFIDYARKNKAVIIFDAAYCEYIQDQNLPKSIYEIEGAKNCCIEIQSFSKSAGFTGVRLGWSVVPIDLNTDNGKGAANEQVLGSANRLWRRRQTTMFNGASNIAQEGGLVVLSEEGQKQTHEQVNYYMENAGIIREGLESMGLKVFGGVNAPYLWVKCPNNLSSWEFFDKILEEAHVICTPGSAFGKGGEGYIRLSAFGHREDIKQAVKSLKDNLKLNL